MNILATNDDGVHHPGLAALVASLSEHHTVFVVAPDRERSAVSHGITIQMPLRVMRVSTQNNVPGFAVTGTPADCVKLGVLELLTQRPDLVVSGINPGPNVGVNLNYSGTVSAAREAAILGLPAVAVSVTNPEASYFDAAANFAKIVVDDVVQRGLPPGVFLNINLPDTPFNEIAGVRVCKQGSARLEEAFYAKKDPRNQTYYWQGSETQLFGDSPDEDGVALRENFISVTPIKCDMTEYGFMDRLKTWNLGLP